MHARHPSAVRPLPVGAPDDAVPGRPEGAAVPRRPRCRHLGEQQLRTDDGPASTAEAAGGDFVVNLDSWKLSGALRLSKLGQTINLPSTSTFTGAANLTQQSLTGRTAITPFTTTVSVVGIQAKVAIRIIPTGPVVGKISLDDDGNLHLLGNAPVSIQIISLNALGLNLGTNCRTDGGTQIPLKFDGPVSALGTGKFTSYSQVTIPTFTDCGAYGRCSAP